MNREIKFRGKTQKGNWVYGNFVNTISEKSGIEIYRIVPHSIAEFVNLCDDVALPSSDYNVVPETVEQFTGIKYKNIDNCICEGDLFYINGWENSINECMYFEQYGVIGYFAHWKNADKICFFDHFVKIPSVEFYYIGNIHDNPELLTQK